MRKITSLVILCCLSSSALAEFDRLPEVQSLNRSTYQQPSRVDSFSRQPSRVESTQQTSPQNPMLKYIEQVNALQQEVQDLRGQLEEHNYRLEQLKSAQNEQTMMLKRQIAALEKGKVEPTKTQVSGPSVNLDDIYKRIDEEKAAAPAKEPVTDTQQYQEAFQILQRKEYEKAEQAFVAFVKSHPHSQYTANAHYWIGEIRLVQADLVGAKEAFDTVLSQYPTHQKSADALLKLGFVAYQEKQFSKARSLLNDVKDKYPTSSSARLAEGRIKRMNSEGV